MLKILLICTGGVVLTIAAIVLYGNARWGAGTTQLLNKLGAAQRKVAPQFFDAKELEGLSAPVKRCFQTV